MGSFKTKKETGSILAFTLMLMMVLIILSIGIVTSSINDRKSSMANEKSNKAFQAANDGTEIVTSKVKNNSTDLISSIIGVCGTDGTMTVDIGGGGKAVLSFYSDPVSGGNLDCNNSDTFADVQRIKSVGQFAETSRAIEVAIAAPATGLGNWEPRGVNVVYNENKDGFVTVSASNVLSGGGADIICQYYGQTPATPVGIERGFASARKIGGVNYDAGDSLMMPVRKMDDWKIKPWTSNDPLCGTPEIFWIPLGS